MGKRWAYKGYTRCIEMQGRMRIPSGVMNFMV